MDINTTEKIIDWASAMDACGDEDTIKEIAKLFLKESKQDIKLLTKAIKAGNSVAIASHAHRLKGKAMMMGVVRLSEKACRLECAGDEKDIEVAALLFDDVKHEFEKVYSFLSRADWIEVSKQQENSKEAEQEANK